MTSRWCCPHAGRACSDARPRTELSLGVVTVIWLTPVLLHADHRRNHVQPGAERHLETVRAWSDSRLAVRAVGDNRRADVVRHVNDDERWRAFEQELTGHLVRVSDLHLDGDDGQQLWGRE